MRQKRNISIFWFTASAADKLESQYRERAKFLRDLGKKDDIVEQLILEWGTSGREVEFVKAWMLAQKEWILVMDNFDTISVEIQSFVPTSRDGKVIFTSRDRRAIETVKGHGFELTKPSTLDAELQFLRQVNSVDFEPPQELQSLPEYPAVKKIVSDLHSFPLALSQAAAYIRENDPLPYAKYLELLTARREDREELLRFKEATPEYPESVMTTWEISFDYVKCKRPEAAMLLQMLGFLAHSDIPAQLFEEATEDAPWSFGTYRGARRLDPGQREELDFLRNRARLHQHVGFLVSLSLISKDRNGYISVHPLVHEWIRARLRPYPEDAAKFVRLCSLVVYQAYPLPYVFFMGDSGIEEGMMWLQILDSHLREVLWNFGQCEYHGNAPAEVRILVIALFLSNSTRPSETDSFLDQPPRVHIQVPFSHGSTH